MNSALNLSADDFILRMPDVERQTGLKKSTLYALIKKGEFPPPISLGKRAVGWSLSSVNKWKQERIAESRKERGV